MNELSLRNQRMTSLEIAEVTGKQHKDVMRAIRNMEEAWVKVQGRKFALSSRNYNLPNGGQKEIPCYDLTKTECLYIADQKKQDFDELILERRPLRSQGEKPAGYVYWLHFAARPKENRHKIGFI